MTKADLYRLIDDLPEGKEETAYRVLKCLHEEKEDPFLLAMAIAPEDDEPFTPEEQEAVREAEEAISRGEVYTLDEVRRELLGES